MTNEFSIKRLDTATGLALGPVVSVDAYGDLIAEGAYSGTVTLRDLNTSEVLDVARTSHLASAVTFSPGGTLLAAGTADQHGLVFQVINKRLIPLAMVPTADDIEATAFCGEDYVLFGGQDRTVTVATVAGKIVGQHVGHRDVVNGIRALADGRIASVADDGEVHIWRIESPADFERIVLDSDINTLAVLPDGRILTGCDKGQVASNGDAIQAHTSAVKAIAIDSRGNRGVSVGYDQKACLFTVESGALRVERHIGLPSEVWPKGVCFANDKIVFGSFRSGSAVYCLRTNRFLNLDSIPDYPCFNAVVHHEGRTYAAGDSGSLICEGGKVAQLPGPVNALVSAHGLLLAGGQTGEVTLAESGTVVAHLGRPINTLTASNRGTRRFVFAGLYGGNVAQFEFDGNLFHLMKEVNLHENSIKGLAVHGEWLGSAAANGTMGFDLIGDEGLTGTQGRRFAEAHHQIANGVSVTGDGTFVSVGRDRKLLLWNSPEHVRSLDAPVTHSIKSVAASRERWIAVGDYRGTLAVFDIKTNTWVLARKISRWGIASLTSTSEGFIAASFGGELFAVAVAPDSKAPQPFSSQEAAHGLL